MKCALTVLIAAILLGAALATSAGAGAGAEPPAASTAAAAPAAATTAAPAAPAAPTASPAPATAGAPAGPAASPAPADSAAQTAPAAPATPDQATPAGGAKPDAKADAKPDAKASTKGKAKSKAGGAAKPAAPAKPPPAPPKPPVPNPALAQLKPLAGTWTCTGHTFGPGPEHPTTATMTLAWHLDGFWLEVRYEEAKAAANPVPVSSVSEWGFDLLQKTLTSASVDNASGVDTQTTAGWQGDKLVFEGSARRFGTQFLDRDTFVRHGDSQLVHTLEASVNDSWIKLHEDTCNRVPSK
ncbi:MAG TPA: hypothetical protein VJA16_13465 [Thermoanaerobaculia bacterium]